MTPALSVSAVSRRVLLRIAITLLVCSAGWSLLPDAAAEQPSKPANPCAVIGYDEAAGLAGGGPIAETWNGRAWSIAELKLPAGTLGGALLGVSCKSAKSCIAVGDFLFLVRLDEQPGPGPAENRLQIRFFDRPALSVEFAV